MRLVTDAAVVSTKSENVIGILPGADKKLRSEHVVLSAHLDHLGIGSEGKDDKLYNGAMDNAAGIAGLLDIARELHAKKVKPRRRIEGAFTLASRRLGGDPARPWPRARFARLALRGASRRSTSITG